MAHEGLTSQGPLQKAVFRIGVRAALYEAANVILTRAVKGSDLKSWALRVAQRAGMKKAKVALARKLAVVLHRMLADGTTFMASNGASSAAVAA